MSHCMRKYGPFVALAFGFLFTIAWTATITWFPIHFVAYKILQIFSVDAKDISRIFTALPLFAAGLGALALGWHRKREQVV